MANTIPRLTEHLPKQNKIECNQSLCSADIPNTMVNSAVDSIISEMAPVYLDLIRESQEKSEIICDYRKSLYSPYSDMNLSWQLEREVSEIQKIAPDCNVITKQLSSDKKISVYLEKQEELSEDQPLDRTRHSIRLNIKVVDLKADNPLDQLLLQLSKKIFSLGYGDTGRFDIRLQRGFLPLATDSQWHFDGEQFKTSITVCYSNKKNWSTRLSELGNADGKPSDHGFLYDAKKVYHRSPIPSDFEGEELSVNDYRLFIRYNEFYTSYPEKEKVIPVKKPQDNPVMGKDITSPLKNFSFLEQPKYKPIPGHALFLLKNDLFKSRKIEISPLIEMPPLLTSSYIDVSKLSTFLQTVYKVESIQKELDEISNL